MSESGIPERQNEQLSLEYLAAQRRLYNEEKWFSTSWFVISTLIAVLGTGALAFLSAQGALIAFLALVIVLGELFLLPVIQRKRTDAAGIQELFDCTVLQLDWNEVLAEKPEAETIRHAVARFRAQKDFQEAFARLSDWYEDPIIDTVPLYKARIACQKESVRWDARQRQDWVNWLIGGLVVLLLALILVGIVAGWSVPYYFAGPLLLMVPPAVGALRSAVAHRRAISRLAELRHVLDILWHDAGSASPDEKTLTQRCREVQNEIYRHRCSDQPVPNFIYEREKRRRMAGAPTGTEGA